MPGRKTRTGSNEMRKNNYIGFLLLVLAFATGLFAGAAIFRTRGAGSDSEYARRLATVEYINSELRKENKRATDLNIAISGRLDRAKGILDELGKETIGAKDAIRRLELNLSILERAIQAIYQDN